MKLLVHASGYKAVPAWTGDRQEILCTLPPPCGGDGKCIWSPDSRDFAATGISSGGSTGAATIAELLAAITQQKPESIDELRILGHANADVFSLAGEVKRDDVVFTKPDALIGPPIAFSDAFSKAIPSFRAVQDRFAANAKVILLGCHAGSGNEGILRICSEAFLRTVQGYKKEIKFNFQWDNPGPPVRNGTQVVCTPTTLKSRITVRGRIAYFGEADALASTFGPESLMAMFKTSVWTLPSPDASNNDGDIFVAVRRTDPGMAATELAHRIMKVFFPGHAWVSGTSVEPKSPGLTVRDNKGSMFIDIKPEWGTKTTPSNLKDRIAEMGRALDLVRAKKAGSVAMK